MTLPLDLRGGDGPWPRPAATGRTVAPDAQVVASDVMARGRAVPSPHPDRRGPDPCIARRGVLVRGAFDSKPR